MDSDLYQKYRDSTGISTDTRTISEKNIFFALKGENFDGNQYALKALDNGASFVVIDDPGRATDDRYILVDNALITLQNLAHYHRQQLDIPIIGITGSNGKTTTKELIYAVLSTKYRIIATSGNLNNHIGVPLTILSIDNNVEIGIVEIGANHIGEISDLCAIANPTHGLITNIGKAHTEGFGGFDGVIRAKSELYHFLIQHNGVVFVNSNQPILSNMANNRIKEPIYYPNKGDFLECKFLKADPYVSYQAENKEIIQTGLIGEYNFENIVTALCVGKYFNISEDEANLAVSEFHPDNNRSQVMDIGSNTVILDAYNANPSSMQAALTSFEEMKGKRKVAILGDMFELGDTSDEEHTHLGCLTKTESIDEVIFCGEKMFFAHKSNPGSHYFPDKVSLEKYLKDSFLEDSLILIKGSRGMGLESILKFL
ncbi:UDP-N-acetylmuramoyl-tripeptide--D-alanyl-D-alanine ligase [Bacteroidota bacterium]